MNYPEAPTNSGANIHDRAALKTLENQLPTFSEHCLPPLRKLLETVRKFRSKIVLLDFPRFEDPRIPTPDLTEDLHDFSS